MTLFWSSRPVGDSGKGAIPANANLTLRTAKRLQKIVLIGALVIVHAANAGTIALDAALSRTLEKNPEIVQARLALEQAAGRRLVLRSTAYPDVKLQVPAGVQGGKRADEPSVRLAELIFKIQRLGDSRFISPRQH